MLKYIVSGQKPKVNNADIDEIDRIVTKVKSRKEVTTAYMRQWDRELSIRRETREEVTKEVTKKVTAQDAIRFIQFCLDNEIAEEKVRKELAEKYEYDDKQIESLFEQANVSV
jgi:hypothetical protein